MKEIVCRSKNASVQRMCSKEVSLSLQCITKHGENDIHCNAVQTQGIQKSLHYRISSTDTHI